MSENTKLCPFCKAQIREDAIKCRYCQSTLTNNAGPSATEKIADLVVKAVGTIPIVMALLLAIAAILGIKAISDVQDSVKQAQASAQAIENERQAIRTLVLSEIERRIDALLNELTIDSSAPQALTIRQELIELSNVLDKEEAGEGQQKSTKRFLLKALFAYYERNYDDALKSVKLADDDWNKFRITGIILSRQADAAEGLHNDVQAQVLREQALEAFQKADKMGKSENRRLLNNLSNLSGAYLKLGRCQDADKTLNEVIKSEPYNQINFFNLAAIESRCGKPAEALEALEKGLKIEGREITKKRLDEDIDIQKLRDSTDSEIQRRYLELLKKIPAE